jgi:hypothetical protein
VPEIIFRLFTFVSVPSRLPCFVVAEISTSGNYRSGMCVVKFELSADMVAVVTPSTFNKGEV